MCSYLKPLDLASLKLQFVFQVTHARLLFTDDATPHSGRLQELHPGHTLLELHDDEVERERRAKKTHSERRIIAAVNVTVLHLQDCDEEVSLNT